MYSREINGKKLTFGVSGLLYRSNVLMYDHQTESLWLQVKRQAVTGPMTGTKLKVLPSSVTTWRKWKKKYPQTRVLSFDTGFNRDYSRDPYDDYYRRSGGFFSSFFSAGPGEKEKEMVAGIVIGGSSKAYPVDLLRKKGKLTDDFGGRKIIIDFDEETDLLSVRDSDGTEIPHVVAYWFVWKGINPDSGLYREK